MTRSRVGVMTQLTINAMAILPSVEDRLGLGEIFRHSRWHLDISCCLNDARVLLTSWPLSKVFVITRESAKSIFPMDDPQPELAVISFRQARLPALYLFRYSNGPEHHLTVARPQLEPAFSRNGGLVRKFLQSGHWHR